MANAERDGLLATDDVSETITDFCAEVVISSFRPKVWKSWNLKRLAGEQSLGAFEKHILLRILDDKW